MLGVNLLKKRKKVVTGIIRKNVKGFAFLTPLSPSGNPVSEVFIPASQLNGSLHGDTVKVEILKKSGGDLREGKVIEIIERKTTQAVGTFYATPIITFVVPDDKRMGERFLIDKHDTLGAVDGHKVLVEITEFPQPTEGKGIVSHIIGHQNDPGVDILSIVHKFGIPTEFPEEVLEQANNVPSEISNQDLTNRRDLRHETIFTIDGEDAKDLDDAIHVKKLENGHFELGVHIADVSHYVTEKSPLDEEALNRGTSVYLVDRVIPMLPHRLSNGICSLNPQVDRLTLSCVMEISTSGHVISYELFPSVINTTERMTYTNVRKLLLEEDPEVTKRYHEHLHHFKHMETLASHLRAKRVQRGSIDFDLNEAKILVDEECKPIDIVLRERSVAEKLIEEFMLVANETVAEHFASSPHPFIYRIHEYPNPDKLYKFFTFTSLLGYPAHANVNEIEPGVLQKMLTKVKGSTDERPVSTLLLRSMQQARYEDINAGHFGLSTDFYTHFTSPIRRYPDLIVHRLIKQFAVESSPKPGLKAKWENALPNIATHSSQMERRAIEAERETEALKKSEFMTDKIGEVYDGVVSSITKFGFFVELPNTIEGLVPIRTLKDDYYEFNEERFALIGKRSSKMIQIGDTVTVKVVAAKPQERIIDFELTTREQAHSSSKKTNTVKKGSRKERFNRLYGHKDE